MPNYERARGEDDTNNPWDTLRDLDLSQESISEQEQESVLENQARIRGKHIMAAAKLLSGSGYEKRHQRTVDNSFSIMRQRGEKLHGSNADRRNEAYLMRLYDRVDERGTQAERALLRVSSGKLIVRSEDIPASYWVAQEQIRRDNGQAGELSDRDKEILTADIQRQQRESLQAWTSYLGHEDCPYPTWFKVYAFDGMSRMATFDSDKKQFRKRNKGTVAPFPHLDAAVLGKTYDAIADFYDLKQEDFTDQEEGSEASETRDLQLEALIKSGNFNKLYSKFLLEKRVILKTPERSEDIHGAWKEYLPGDEEALANAADGTPWCIASPTVGKNYLETGGYGNSDIAHNEDSKAKFILFHLQDPETGQLAENACASIRLGTDGQVAEISGLNEGQALEDALVPEVEAKVKTLPGGEKYLRAFADKQHLIALDRKMQAGEHDFTQEDLDFIFEQDRKIETLDTYNASDPRVSELRVHILQSEKLKEYYPDGLHLRGNLDLAYSEIAELPEDLSVEGDLDLSDTKITEISKDLNVGGGLYLSGTRISEFPEGLDVKGDLDLRHTNITKLPEGLSVGGGLNLYGTKITKLPKELSVNGYLLLNAEITELPEGLSIGGNLDLMDTNITELPNGLRVGGNLCLRKKNIAKLPEELSVGGSLDLRGTNIAELPEGLSVGGNLYLRGTNIAELPEGLSVGDSLDLRGTNIAELPEGLSVGGSLDLRGTNIAELPEYLDVGRHIIISSEMNLEAPSNLRSKIRVDKNFYP